MTANRIFKVIHPTFDLEGLVPKRESFIEFSKEGENYKVVFPFNINVLWKEQFLNKKIKDKDIKEMHFAKVL